MSNEQERNNNSSEYLYKDIFGEDETEEHPTKTRFQILSNTSLHIDYDVLPDGTCITEESSSIELLEGLGSIKVLERDIPYSKNLFKGGPEPILSDGFKFVQPTSGLRNLEGEDLKISRFGEWGCVRCEHINYVPVINGHLVEPYECENDVCGRKGPFRPLFPKELMKPIWKLPLQPIPAGHTEIYTDVYNFAKKYLVLNPDDYHILTLWIMASWLVDDFNTCPYLCMIAPKESGKTQVLNILSELAYRSVMTISVTAASLFRAIELWKITLLVDEAEFQVKTETEAGQALYGCLNGGYKRGSFAIRTEGDNSSRVPATYEVFGFKAIAATKLFHPTLESRSIVFNMSQGRPEKLLIDSNDGAVLRSKLLFWRFATLGKLPLVQPKSTSGRLIEMFTPLFTVAQVLKKTDGIILPIKYNKLVELLNNKINEMEATRKQEEQDTTEAKIVKAIVSLKNDCGDDGKIKVTDVAREMKWVTEETDSKEAVKACATIGRTLKIIGIHTKHTDHGNMIMCEEPETEQRIKELEKRYLSTEA